MFTVDQQTLEENRSIRYLLKNDGKRLTFIDFLTLLHQQEKFRSFFIETLSTIPFKAYHWETPALTKQTKDQAFEFVVTNTPGIDLPPDPGPFRQYFGDDGKKVAVFNNLGNDALLIAPPPLDDNLNYSHIGVFTQEAPPVQQQDFWKTVGQVTRENVSDQPLWLNTAGGGVAWLHVRLDSRPKYYRHLAYARS